MQWIKASERLPERNADIVWRRIGQTNLGGFSYKNNRFYRCGEMGGYFDNIEWLDESPTEIGQQGVEEAKKIFEYIQRNANKINEHTWKAYKEQILAHVEDGLAISTPPKEGQDELWDEVHDAINGVCYEVVSNSEVNQLIKTLSRKYDLIKK